MVLLENINLKIIIFMRFTTELILQGVILRHFYNADIKRLSI